MFDDGQGNLACCSPWGRRESDTTEWLNWTEDKRSNLSHPPGFPRSSVVKKPPANAGDVGSISGSGRSPEERSGNPFQYSCLGNPTDRGAWWATIYGDAKESNGT